MPPASEAGLIYLFAGTLVVAAVVLAFIPAFRHMADFAVSRKVLAVVLAGTVGIAAAAVAFVTTAAADPAYFLPIIGVTVVLRVAAPVSLYRRVRDWLDTRTVWAVLQKLVTGAFLGLAALLAYGLFVVAGGGTPIGIVVVSEQVITALGAAVLFTRLSIRLRPREAKELWPIWWGSLLLGVAFVAILPYAVPAFTVVYMSSGLIGWGVAAFVAFRDR